jgi:MerR family transcriptional regulator, copper efflux regulator
MLINEVAKITGMSKDGIRHYEEMGLISSTPRQAGSRIYREYDPSVIETIEMVRHGQLLGFSLKEIGPLLKAYNENPPTREQTVEFLEARLAVIREKLAALREVEDFICRKLERYREPEAPAHLEIEACTSQHRDFGKQSG